MPRKSIAQLTQIRKSWLDKYQPYTLMYFDDFNYKILSNVFYKKKSGKNQKATYNDITIMFDTETSKSAKNTTYTVYSKKLENNITKYNSVTNYVVAWSICLYALDRPIVTLWGRKPSELVTCINRICDNMNGQQTYIYAHNLAYDWTFCRRFFIKNWGTPTKQLNTKSHYPIQIEFESKGKIITFKDSLCLAQRSLEKWANDLNVPHKKAVGCWDYDKIRTQHENYTPDELKYIECDVLAGCECIESLKKTLNKFIYSMPYTATGIPREEVRKLAQSNNYRQKFLAMCLSYEQYIHMTKIYHGGYTHANRHYIGLNTPKIFNDNVVAFDFASSYPFVMLSEKYPIEKFYPLDDMTIDEILEDTENTAYIFDLIMINPRLKNDFIPMPALQFSKCEKAVDEVLDNGRVLCASMVKIPLNDVDLQVINAQYDYDFALCTNVECATKGYLPRWFTDYIFKLFEAKTKLKTSNDPVAYAIAKSKLNSLYGMTVQKSIRDNIVEKYVTAGDYNNGDYVVELDVLSPEELYQKYIDKFNSVLPYQWGVYVTSYAFRNLFELGSCIDYENGGQWLYSDTDSCYGIKWDISKVDEYNKKAIAKLKSNNYGGVFHEGKNYYLGIAEFDGEYSEFITLGAKRYCCRYADVDRVESKKHGTLKITVAGVPKKGVKCLNDNIDNFKKYMVFDGLTTGKLTHAYLYVDDICVDDNGNEYADSIDLTPCDYLLDDVEIKDWESLFYERIEVQTYED